MCGNSQDAGQIAADIDLHLAVHRRQHDIFDQRADDVRRLNALFLAIIPKRLVKLLNAFAVLLRHGWMEKGRWLLGRRQEGVQFGFACP
ncbi:hypothetical protein [Agrobacterium sp. B1(2019)]|uniref:hypothetical protein n=1 Tax=Agrobacterium sp. B1(2019) TaxID=2607032 RepID=UPI001FF0508D|nr:hypothetical protein [Agrobacterium sp. B1(2019)]